MSKVTTAIKNEAELHWSENKFGLVLAAAFIVGAILATFAA